MLALNRLPRLPTRPGQIEDGCVLIGGVVAGLIAGPGLGKAAQAEQALGLGDLGGGAFVWRRGIDGGLTFGERAGLDL